MLALLCRRGSTRLHASRSAACIAIDDRFCLRLLASARSEFRFVATLRKSGLRSITCLAEERFRPDQRRGSAGEARHATIAFLNSDLRVVGDLSATKRTSATDEPC
jgi:hypothetical protein